MTLARSARALNQQTFQAFLKERPKVIVHTGPGSSPGTFLPGVITHFGADLGDGVAFGAFDTSTLLYAPWLMKFVGTLWTTVPSSAPDGYYLFVDGSARAFHPGTTGIEPDAALSTIGVGMLFSLMSDSAAPMKAATQAINNTHARVVIAFFEEVLARPLSPNVPLDWSKFFEAVNPKAEDPYAKLGLTPSATREEVRKAHRDKSALGLWPK